MYAQLFYISEEGVHIAQTERVFIDDSLQGLLTIPVEHEGNNAYWGYFENTENGDNRQFALANYSSLF
jgi:hypothetical protein